MVQEQAQPTEYKIVHKGKCYPYEVKARWTNRRWVTMITSDSFDFAMEYLVSRRVDTRTVKLQDKG